MRPVRNTLSYSHIQPEARDDVLVKTFVGDFNQILGLFFAARAYFLVGK